jgi:hypothetical protein
VTQDAPTKEAHQSSHAGMRFVTQRIYVMAVYFIQIAPIGVLARQIPTLDIGKV